LNELQQLGVIDKKTKSYVVNGSGIDLARFCYSSTNTASISFLMIARLVKSKGVREYAEACEIVKKQYPNVTFRLVGGPEFESIDTISADLYEKIKSGDVIEYLGATDDVRPFISESSAVVLPSYAEGTPRSILEAMAMGRAIITTDAPGCRETVNHLNPNGFLIPVQDVNTLADKMKYFIDNPEELIKMGAAGRKFAEDKYDVRKVNQHMLEIINR
jgi:glycosyltransferase involved in cell wall biosynthesis